MPHVGIGIKPSWILARQLIGTMVINIIKE